MKKSLLIAVILTGAIASSCNLAKTCPTYAKGKNQGVETIKNR